MSDPRDRFIAMEGKEVNVFKVLVNEEVVFSHEDFDWSDAEAQAIYNEYAKAYDNDLISEIPNIQVIEA